MNTNRKIGIFLSKLRRSFDMLFDRSEIFDEEPWFRYQIISNIWKDKY